MKKTTYYLISAAIVLTGIFVSCEKSSDSDGISNEAGTGGSLARFTIANDHLYTVEPTKLKAFSLSDYEKPKPEDEVYLGFGVETIFPRGNTLFLGTQIGMYIFDITQPGSPSQLSFYSHVSACDPVVATQDFAYVTLNTASIFCPRTTNELQIIDISDLQNPKLKKSYDMVSPLGLSINNDTLYVCDDGIKVLDVSDYNNIKQLHHFSNIQANDIIYYDGLLIAIGDKGFYQYKVEGDEIEKISEILIGE